MDALDTDWSYLYTAFADKEEEKTYTDLSVPLPLLSPLLPAEEEDAEVLGGREEFSSIEYVDMEQGLGNTSVVEAEDRVREALGIAPLSTSSTIPLEQLVHPVLPHTLHNPLHHHTGMQEERLLSTTRDLGSSPSHSTLAETIQDARYQPPPPFCPLQLLNFFLLIILDCFVLYSMCPFFV